MTSDPTAQRIRGRLVYLRALEADDVALVHRWYQDARTAALMGELPRSLAAMEARYRNGIADQGRDSYPFLICRLEDDVPVGRLDLFAIDRANGSADFGIAIGDREQRGRGYGRDAVEALSDFAFEELRLERLHLLTDATNVRAHRTYQAAGFTVEAVERRAFFQHGRFTDAVHMSLLRHEWEALPRRAVPR
jgi:RimJ/RimL family protein N-acetyltransferase